MRVNIVTTGRFHVLDLARELSHLGYEVAFYSCLPRARARRFGLPTSVHRRLLGVAAPFALAGLFGPRVWRPAFDILLLNSVDRLAAHFMKNCEVFIGMSGLCVESAAAARKRFGATVFIERGSRHILSQKEILDGIGSVNRDRESVPRFHIERELAGYEIADVIVVPSRHVEQSFLEKGISRKKLFRNPYGVDLSMFPATASPPKDPPTVIFVGCWSLQKGCDVLVKAWRTLKGVNLLHVGAVGDAPMPNGPGFLHHDPVPQWKLKEFYGKAHVFVLASRQEGLSLVQAQALACGLPVVCTDRTGGEDLRDFVDDPSWIHVVPVEDHDALAEAIAMALERARSMSGMRDLLGAGREKLSWRAYGERYECKLKEFTYV